jgi:N-acetylglucosamine malate deacetylase 1
MNDYKVDILAFGAHPDDVECAVGGTILSQIQKGYKVAIVDLTRGELGSSGTVEIRNDETIEASKILGIHHRENLEMEDGFIENSKTSKLKIIEVIRKYQPKIILATALNDRHPDHENASKLITDASFLSGLVKIKTEIDNNKQIPHRPIAVYHYIQDLLIKPDFVIDISHTFDDKMKAIKAYKSQFLQVNNTEPNGANALLKQIEATNSIFGRAINVKFAEGFNSNRYIGTNDIMNLF